MERDSMLRATRVAEPTVSSSGTIKERSRPVGSIISTTVPATQRPNQESEKHYLSSGIRRICVSNLPCRPYGFG
jgi:hypothetical protein